MTDYQWYDGVRVFVNLYNVNELWKPAGAAWLCNECAIIHEEMVEFAGHGTGESDQTCDICKAKQRVWRQRDFFDKLAPCCNTGQTS